MKDEGGGGDWSQGWLMAMAYLFFFLCVFFSDFWMLRLGYVLCCFSSL